jgi:hypothetical protein
MKVMQHRDAKTTVCWKPLRRLLLAGVAVLVACNAASADVIVLANRTARDIALRFAPVSGYAQSVTLGAGENMPFYLDGKADVSFTSTGGSQSLRLDANCAYYFSRGTDGRVDLQKIGLGEDGTLTNGRTLPGSASQAPSATITVKILVDEEEPGRQPVWERRLRARVEAASAVFEKYFHTKLQVVAVGTWNSDNKINDFIESLGDFERKVSPAPAQLAIGFTSQWRMQRGRLHMAGTRGPLHPYILAREGSPEISEAAKLEFLIHELGHYFGAAHSPERESIMRPVLGDNKSTRTNYRVQFDPVNTLAIAIISEEMRRRHLTSIGELAPETRKRLSQIYTEITRSLPDDPAAAIYAQLMKSESGTPLVNASRQVLQSIGKAATDNRTLPAQAVEGTNIQSRRAGDVLTNYLVREAARAAQAQPDDVKLKAFLFGLGVGLNESEVQIQVSAAGNAISAIETPGERPMRVMMLGQPTLREHRELMRPFLSGVLQTATTSAEAAQAAGIANELTGAQRGGGFSFRDIAANRAGARFARGVLDKKIPMGLLAMAFSTSSYVPAVDDLPEKLSQAELTEQFGNKDDPRFTKMLEQIDAQIGALPGYKPIGPTLKL